MQSVEDFNQYRSVLFGLAYRMLGSVMDAEDIVQEAFLLWQHGDPAKIESPKAYLTTIVTRLCIDHMRLASVQREEYVGAWLPEPLVIQHKTEADPDHAELADSLSMAFLVLLERLRPLDRAVFLLHDIFGYTFPEVANIVGKSVVDCRQIGHRARTRIMTKQSYFTANPDRVRQVTQQFIDTCTNGDMPGLLNLLTRDITLWSDGGGKVQAARNVIVGTDHVARFLLGIRHKAETPAIFSLADNNGQIAVIEYDCNQPVCVNTFSVHEERICTIYRVLNPDKLRHIPLLGQR